MTTILALDLGTATGWALRTADGRTNSSTQSFKPGRFEGGWHGTRWQCSTPCALGHAPGDDNEADALALLTWAVEQDGESEGQEKNDDRSE